MNRPELRQIITDAIAYWEPRRLIYNAALAIVTVIGHFTSTASWKPTVGFDMALGLFFLAVIANILYCAAYLPDAFVHLSDFRHRLRVVRTVIFTTGILLACAIAWGISHPSQPFPDKEQSAMSGIHDQPKANNKGCSEWVSDNEPIRLRP